MLTLSDEIMKYLKGDNFSNGLAVKYSRINRINYKFNLLENFLSQTKAIHLGCCDHIPLIEKKIKKDIWLHGFLTRLCDQCIGIDINHEGIDILRKRFGVTNVVNGDILTSEIELINASNWDFIVLADILEHIDNSQYFLKSIHNKYHTNISKIIITVPNALSLINIKYTLKNSEIINSDHRFWFTPYTLAKTVLCAGFKISGFCFCQPGKSPQLLSKHYLNPANIINDTLIRFFPMLSETIFLLGEF